MGRGEVGLLPALGLGPLFPRVNLGLLLDPCPPPPPQQASCSLPANAVAGQLLPSSHRAQAHFFPLTAVACLLLPPLLLRQP